MHADVYNTTIIPREKKHDVFSIAQNKVITTENRCKRKHYQDNYTLLLLLAHKTKDGTHIFKTTQTKLNKLRTNSIVAQTAYNL